MIINMENIMIDKSNIDVLIQKLLNEKIHDSIDIEFVSNLFEVIESNNPIPIEYYRKKLNELPKSVERKCEFHTCKRKALYIDEDRKNYCWIHCQ